MTAKIIDIQDYKAEKTSDWATEYRLLKEIMTALFGTVDETDHPLPQLEQTWDEPQVSV